MTRTHTSIRFHRTALSLALCAAFVTVQAQTKSEEGSVSVGIGALSGSSADHAVFGQYNGLRPDRSVVGTLGIEYGLRDEEKSNWIQLLGTNLLGDTRELSAVWKNPGNWKLSADYSELVRYDPNTVNTGLRGSGSATPQVVYVAPGMGADLELKTKRSGLGLGFTKFFSPALQFEMNVKREDKDGSRLSGMGMNCPSLIAPGCGGTTASNTGWATLMLPEAVHSSHAQVDARMAYAAEQFRVSLGYYGSFYTNSNGTLAASVPASLGNGLTGGTSPLSTGLQTILGQPLALPPDNQAHQLDLTGSYDITKTTRANFKLAYGIATQNQDFASAGLSGAPAGVTNLGGEVRTTLAKIGLTSRPIPKLTLLADLRYEDRDDATPIARYNVEGTDIYTNRALPNRKTKGKLQAAWQFNSDYRGSLSTDYEAIDRGVFTSTSAMSGISALRQKTDETGVTAELRRKMSQDFSGSVSLSSSKRNGSNWLKDNSGLGVTEIANPADPVNGFASSAIFMPTLANRQRDKAKIFADWVASESLTLQFSAEGGNDTFSAPTSYGLRITRMSQFSVDAGYAISDKWALTAYASQGNQTLNQARSAGYVLAYDNTSTSIGLGVTGKPTGTLEVGGSLSFTDDKSVYAQTLDGMAGTDSIALLAASGGLPNIVYRQTALKLFGKYAVDKKSTVRVDLVHQRSNVNDWAWGYNGVPYAYSDGTTVSQKPTQSVSVLGVTYVYQLQ
jgi:MtrB/PioB family decaheme-associated outer membrane protein